MCGITGFILDNHGDMEQASNLLKSSFSVIRHRGPDDEGIFVDKEKGVLLGNARLAILDLSFLGHMPMENGDKSIVITYNGEVYNFKLIRKELEAKGYNFGTNTDTEVVLKAYEEWKEDSFRKLSGMFAFSIYDKKQGLVYLVRDHAGIKPLYYSVSGGRFFFASEVRVFKTFNKEWEENKDWRIYFLSFGHIPEPFTTLKNVYMLPKESFLKFDVDNMKYCIQKYESIEFSAKVKNIDEAVCGIKNLFSSAVKSHLISDVPIGVFLSGGIDSSLVAILASKYKGVDLRTLSVVFKEKGYCEEDYQNIVLRKIKSNHRNYLVTADDFIKNIDDIFLGMDQPSSDGINTYFISKCAKEEGLKVVLSGLGSDEIFGGYSSFNKIRKLWWIKDSPLQGLFRMFKFINKDSWKKLCFLSIDNPIGYYLALRGFYTPNQVSRIVNIDIHEVNEALKKLYFNVAIDLGPKNFISYLETNYYMQNQLLKDTDYMSMWHSIEIRVPFLDKELMKFVFSIDEKIKFNENIYKYLLVKAFGDILPEEIIKRKKVGFTFPFDKWIRENSDTFVDLIPQVHRSKVVKDFNNNGVHWSKFWTLAVMGRWS